MNKQRPVNFIGSLGWRVSSIVCKFTSRNPGHITLTKALIPFMESSHYFYLGVTPALCENISTCRTDQYTPQEFVKTGRCGLNIPLGTASLM